MSGALFQNVAVAAIVVGAVSFLVWKRVRARRRATPFCENCPGCEAGSSAPQGRQLLNIEPPRPRRH